MRKEVKNFKELQEELNLMTKKFNYLSYPLETIFETENITYNWLNRFVEKMKTTYKKQEELNFEELQKNLANFNLKLVHSRANRFFIENDEGVMQKQWEVCKIEDFYKVLIGLSITLYYLYQNGVRKYQEHAISQVINEVIKGEE